MRYYPWDHDHDNPLHAWLTYAPNALVDEPKEYEIFDGIPAQRWFPRDVVFELADDHGIELTDAIPNSLNLYLVSERFKVFLEKWSEASIEFLPIRIRNQKGRLETDNYYIMNLLGTVGCVDLEKSKFRRSAMEPERIFRFYLLVLNEALIPPSTKLFRLKEQPNIIIAREDLVQKILNEGFSGVVFQEMEEHGMEWGRR
jgi:hypothetical protein